MVLIGITQQMEIRSQNLWLQKLYGYHQQPTVQLGMTSQRTIEAAFQPCQLVSGTIMGSSCSWGSPIAGGVQLMLMRQVHTTIPFLTAQTILTSLLTTNILDTL